MFIVAIIQIDEYLNTNFAVSKGTVSLGCVLSEIVSRFSEQDKPDLQSIKPEHTGFTVYSAPVCTGLLPPKRSDFHSAERTGLVWYSVNSIRIRYENHYAPM